MILYHGSKNIIEHPKWGAGNPHNDYGLGFYCTESIDLAKEWACVTEKGGFANRYDLNSDRMSVLELTGGKYHILNWMAILLENRTFRTNADVARNAKEYILTNFLLNYQEYDIITGYRADDSYFAFANAFLNNTISLWQLEEAMLYGKLGVQIVLKSERAFEQLQFLDYDRAEGSTYYPKRVSRDQDARKAFQQNRKTVGTAEDIYMIDILRGRWQDDDSRLQRVILG